FDHRPLRGMDSSLTTWAGRIGFILLLMACGGSTENPPSSGSGGAGGTSGVPDGGSGGTKTGGPGPVNGHGTTNVGGTGGGGGSAGGTGGGGGAGGSQTSGAIALLDSEVPSNQDQPSWLDAGETLMPTTLIVAVSTEGLTCAAPDFRQSTMSHATVVLG